MENVEVVAVESERTGEDEFELKMLDCGTNYRMDAAFPTCLSCFCGTGGCFCSTEPQGT